MGEIQSNDILLEAENPEKLTPDDLKNIKTINNFLRNNIKDDGKSLDKLQNKDYLKLNQNQKQIFLAYDALKDKIGNNIKFVNDFTSVNGICRNLDLKGREKKFIEDNKYIFDFSSNSTQDQISHRYNRLITTEEISAENKLKLKSVFMTGLEKLTKNKQINFYRKIDNYESQYNNINFDTNPKDTTSEKLKLTKENLKTLTKILNSWNKNTKYKRKVTDNERKIISQVNYEYKNDFKKNLETKISELKTKKEELTTKLEQEEQDLNHQKYKISILDRGNETANKIPFDLSSDSIQVYNNLISGVDALSKSSDDYKKYFFKKLYNTLNEYCKKNDIDQNVRNFYYNAGYSSTSSWGELLTADLSSIDFTKEKLLTSIGIKEIESTIDQDKELLGYSESVSDPTKILGVYNKIQQINGLSEYGQAIKTEWTQQMRKIMPQNEIENEHVDIIDGFSDKLYNQLRNNPKCYIGFDGDIYGGTEEQKKSIEIGEGDNLQKFIQKDFALLASKYISYDHFMLAINSENTNFSGKDKLTEDQYKRLYNYIKYGAPTNSADYKFSQIGGSGQCKEIKELQGLLNTLDPRLSNKLDANNEAGLDGKYGFATAETYRSLAGVLNQASNEIEYFAQFEQVHLFQDVSGSMTSVTPIVENNIKMYANGTTDMNFHSNHEAYGGNCVEKGLNQIKKYIENNFNELKQSNDKKLFRIYTDERDQSDEENVKIILNLMSEINGTCDIVVCEHNPPNTKNVKSKIVPLEKVDSDEQFKDKFFDKNKTTKIANLLFEDIQNDETLSDFNLSKAPQTYLTTENKQDFLFGILQLSPNKQLKYFNFISKKVESFGINMEDIQNLWKYIGDYQKNDEKEKESLKNSFWEKVDEILATAKEFIN